MATHGTPLQQRMATQGNGELKATHCGNSWQLMATHGNSWQLMVPWQLMATHENFIVAIHCNLAVMATRLLATHGLMATHGNHYGNHGNPRNSWQVSGNPHGNSCITHVNHGNSCQLM
jgi:hypothetical protein